MTPGTTIPEGSPSLDQPLRSRHEAALDIAIKALREARRVTILAVSAACDLEGFRPEDTNVVRRIDRALSDIATLMDGTTDPPPETRNTDWPAIAAVVNKDYRE